MARTASSFAQQLRASLRQRDFLAGLLFLFLGAVTTLEGAGLHQGSAERMGPGYLPLRIGLLLAAIGLVIAIKGARGERAGVERFAGLPILAATAALTVFGFAIEDLGLIPASALLVLAARAISWRGRAVELTALVVVLAAIVVVVFRYGLGVPVPLWPTWGA
ncbi:tripartite tricarboxylate transporter TctB family protein [Uliginosibacterium sp. sgz301328]|uniref:tripartite tricarboxylate transporter TctB family protein n=1 Tax=Uliginosibacterium sp. sgz301328 TaxID=3243764 RepID=UPI00359DC4EC